MFDAQPAAIRDKLVQLTKRLDSYTCAVVLRLNGQSVYSIISANDATLVWQALRQPMTRSAKKKLRKRIFEKTAFVSIDQEFLSEIQGGAVDPDAEPFVCCFLGEGSSRKYALMDAQSLKHFEYVLYVGHNVLLEKFYRWF